MTPAFTSPSVAPAATTTSATTTTRTRSHRAGPGRCRAAADGGDPVGVLVGRIGVAEELALGVRHRPLHDGRSGRIGPEPCLVGLHVHGRSFDLLRPELELRNHYAAPTRPRGARCPRFTVPPAPGNRIARAGGRMGAGPSRPGSDARDRRSARSRRPNRAERPGEGDPRTTPNPTPGPRGDRYRRRQLEGSPGPPLRGHQCQIVRGDQRGNLSRPVTSGVREASYPRSGKNPQRKELATQGDHQ